MSKAYLTRHELADFLSSNGFPISASTLAKLSMPSARKVRPMPASGATARFTILRRRCAGPRTVSGRIGAQRRNP